MSSPGKSFRSRMGGVMRRTSSVLTIAKLPTSTPPADDSSRRSSTSGSVSKNAEAKKSSSSLTQAAVASEDGQPVTVAAENTPTAVAVAPSEPTSEEPAVTVEPAGAETTATVEPASEAVLAPVEPEAPTLALPTPPSSPLPPSQPMPNGNGAPKSAPAIKRLLPIAAQYQMYPSPISESPVREAQATAEEEAEKAQREPSPLANTAGVELALSAPPGIPEPVPEPAPVDAAEPVVYVPPPLVLDSSNPGAFTDEPEDMHGSEPAVALPLPEPEPEQAPVPVVAIPEPEPAPALEPLIAVPVPEPATALDPPYFDLVPPPTSLQPVQELSPNSTVMPVDAEEWHRAVAIEPFPYDQAASAGDTQEEAPSMPVPVLVPAPESSATSQPIPIPSPRVPILTDVQDMEMSNEDAAPAPAAEDSPVQVHAGGWWEMAVDGPTGTGVSRGMPEPTGPEEEQDPFADPPQQKNDSVFLIPIAVVDTDAGYDVQKRMEEGYAYGSVPAADENHDEGQRFSTLPIPMPAGIPFPTDGLFGSIRSMPSAENLSRQSPSASPNREFLDQLLRRDEDDIGPAGERRPLLARPPTPDDDDDRHRHRKYHATTTTLEGPDSQTLHDLGWLVYALPNGLGVYYVHPTLRVTTDADLRVPVVLARVGRAVGYSADRDILGLGSGRDRKELWLREVPGGKHRSRGKDKGKGKARGDLGDLGLARWWIDHAKREASAGDDIVGREDHLDMEYRYWAYMESHPAHAVIPFAVRREAVDLLTWSWTDRLLPPQEQERPLPSPFTQGECQELLGVLRSFGDVPQAETGIQSIVLTRIVSRIMLRVAHWRQHHFRPHKPLPVDFWAGSGSTQSQARSQKAGFVRTAMDILVSCLLLGVPFLFYSKHGALRSDAEGGGIVQRNVIPVLVVGACTCLLAALLLSASITFLSLPGLDNAPPARVVVLVVAVLAAASVVAGLVALFRFKADLLAEDGTGAAAVGMLNPAMLAGARSEGMMLISTRTVIMSLPLVLLIYAVLGFVAAVVLYSFFGTGTAGGRFADYTRWAVLGAVGGLGGILTMSALLLRR